MDVCLLDFLSGGAVDSAQPSCAVTTLIVSPQVCKSEGDTDMIDSWRHRLSPGEDEQQLEIFLYLCHGKR